MPISSLAEARDLITAHFVALWNAQSGTAPLLVYDDRHKDLPANAPYARITVRHNVMDQRTLGNTGNRRFRRFGVVVVQIFTVANDGLTKADVFAKVALDAFEGNSTAPDEVHFRNVRVNEEGENGNWFQTNVLADFDYDEIK